jgi:hypothetical protein
MDTWAGLLNKSSRLKSDKVGLVELTLIAQQSVIEKCFKLLTQFDSRSVSVQARQHCHCLIISRLWLKNSFHGQIFI